MNESAICHQSESPFAPPLGKGMFLFRLRLGIEDKGDKVLVHFGNKYLFPKRRNTAEAKPLYEARNFVYFEAVCQLDDPRLAYVFEIKEGGESLFLSERGLSKGYDFERSYEDFFQYPYVHEGAVPRLPEWTQNAVFYQIFPDRFFRGERGKDDSYINLKWGEKPVDCQIHDAELDFRPRGCFPREETLHNHEKAYRIVRLVGLGKRTLIELKGLQKGEKLLYKVPNSDLIYVSLIVYMRKKEKSR